MVWLLNSQGMKNCKSTESFCRSILAIYTNDWSTFWLVYCSYIYFFSGKFLKVRRPRTTTYPLRQPGPAGLAFLWKWASMFTKLPGDGVCRLALFHAVRNFLANETDHFSRLSHQTTFLLGKPAPHNQLLI